MEVEIIKALEAPQSGAEGARYAAPGQIYIVDGERFLRGVAIDALPERFGRARALELADQQMATMRGKGERGGRLIQPKHLWKNEVSSGPRAQILESHLLCTRTR